MNKTTAYLDALLHYDWKNFNLETDPKKQWQAYKNLLDGFKVSLHEERDYAATRSLLSSYEERYQNLPFMGIFHTRINPFLLLGQLREILKIAELEALMEENPTQCGCDLRQKLELGPEEKFLTKTGNRFDGYYHTDLYECTICHSKWGATADEATGENKWEKE